MSPPPPSPPPPAPPHSVHTTPVPCKTRHTQLPSAVLRISNRRARLHGVIGFLEFLELQIWSVFTVKCSIPMRRAFHLTPSAFFTITTRRHTIRDTIPKSFPFTAAQSSQTRNCCRRRHHHPKCHQHRTNFDCQTVTWWSRTMMHLAQVLLKNVKNTTTTMLEIIKLPNLTFNFKRATLTWATHRPSSSTPST